MVPGVAGVAGLSAGAAGADAEAAPGVAIVIPAYNAEANLRRVLPAALRAAHAAGSDARAVCVVDPGSSDATAQVAAELGARVISLGHRAGPAEARNAGVRALDAEVVLFVDSDCVPHEEVVCRVREAFASDPDLVALTGSYDDDPPERNFFSQYMNLRHHFTHQHGRRDGASFWAGCGAVRRSAFLEAGGFDPARYPEPMIEDIELGTRMAALGRTRLDPALQVTHLKHWTLRSVVETDIARRAVPWARLIFERGALPNDLNLRTSQRVAAALAPLALAAVVALLPLLLAGAGGAATVAAGCIALSAALNAPMLGFFAARRGLGFAVGAWLFHQLHLTYSAATFAACALAHRLAPAR